MNSRSNVPNYFTRFWILFFPIASYFFYGYMGFNDTIRKATYFLALPITIIFVLNELSKRNKDQLYSNLVKTIFIINLVSILMSYFFWNQDFNLSYRVTAVYLGIVYFFYLLKSNSDLVFIEKVIWLFCLLYLVVWTYGLSKAPEHVVGIPSELDISNERGIYRFFVYGSGILELCFFLAINKYKDTHKKYWIAIFSFLFIIIVLHLTRQVIALSLIFGLYFLLKGNRYLIIGLCLVGIISWIAASNIKFSEDNVIGNLIQLTTRQVDQQKSGEENVRIKEYRYFFTDFSKNFITDLFGNGNYHSESNYGKKFKRLALEERYYSSDVGYADIYIKLGFMGLLFYGLIFYRVLKQKVPSQYAYARLYIVYLFFVNFGSSYILFNTILLCFCLYILETCNTNTILKINDEKNHLDYC